MEYLKTNFVLYKLPKGYAYTDILYYIRYNIYKFSDREP